jgi:hypothetical protein
VEGSRAWAPISQRRAAATIGTGGDTVTITGSYQGLSASAQITLYDAPALPLGTVRWSVPPLPGNSLQRIQAGRPLSTEDADAYFIERASSSQAQLSLRALTSDGRQKWVYPIGFTISQSGSSPSAGRVVPMSPAPRGYQMRRSRKGRYAPLTAPSNAYVDLIASAVSSAGNMVLHIFEEGGTPFLRRESIVAVDPNGSELWRYHADYGSGVGRYVELSFALDPAGKVYVLKYFDDDGSTSSAPNVKHSVLALDEQTGSELFRVPLATAWYDSQFHPGLLSVLPDGKVYVPVASAPDPGNPNSSGPVAFSVVRITPEGSAEWIPVNIPAASTCNSQDSFPHEVLPDNNGGFVVTNECSAGVFALRFTADATPVGTAVTLPFSELQSYPWDNSGDAVLSENYLFVQGDGRIVGMNLATGALDLNYACTSECKIVSAADGDQVVVLQGNDGAQSVTLTPQPGGPGGAVPWTINAPAGTTLWSYDYFGQAPPFSNEASVRLRQFYASVVATVPASLSATRSATPQAFSLLTAGASVVANTIVSSVMLWPALAEQSQRGFRRADVATFIPLPYVAYDRTTDPPTPTISDRSAFRELGENVPQKRIRHDGLLASNGRATSSAFLTGDMSDTGETWNAEAIAFVGHSVLIPGPLTAQGVRQEYAGGLRFIDRDILVQPNPQDPLLNYIPNPPRSGRLPHRFIRSVAGIRAGSRVKVVFVGDCRPGKVFLDLWDITGSTPDKAILVPYKYERNPDGSVKPFDPLNYAQLISVDLLVALNAWYAFAGGLAVGETAEQARGRIRPWLDNQKALALPEFRHRYDCRVGVDWRFGCAHR